MSANGQTTRSYKIILTGELREDVDQQQAIAAFAKLVKLSPQKAAAIFTGAPTILKKDVDAETAKKYQNALHTIGMVSLAEPIATPAPVSDAETSVAPQTADSKIPAATPSPSVEEPESPRGLAYKIEAKPDYSFLTVQLPANETLKVEASAMATMDTTVRMKTRMKGGLGRLITGENLFINEFTAQAVPGEIGIAPGTPGDLMHQYLDGNTIFLQNSAYVASTMDVTVETKWQGLTKGFFSGESLFLIRCSGKGDLWFSTYGAIIEIDVDSDYVVDTGNIVAFTEGLDYKITKVGGYKSLFFSGEGFVCRFSGQGKVWIQTRGTAAFTSWAHFYRPTKGSN